MTSRENHHVSGLSQVEILVSMSAKSGELPGCRALCLGYTGASQHMGSRA